MAVQPGYLIATALPDFELLRGHLDLARRALERGNKVDHVSRAVQDLTVGQRKL